MRRVQILLEPRQHEFLVREARRCGVSVSEMLRRYTSARMGDSADDDHDPLESLAGIAASAEGDIAVNHDHYLYDDPRD